MFKNNKGITMVALVITIIILGILATIAIRSSSPVIQEAKLEDVRTTLLLIQAKWKVEKEKVTFDGTSMFPETLVVTQADVDADNTKKKGYLKDEYKVTEVKEIWNVEEGDYYQLNQECLNAMGLQEISASDGYIVNYSNNDIIYEKGFKYTNQYDEEKTYYKLSEIEELYE